MPDTTETQLEMAASHFAALGGAIQQQAGNLAALRQLHAKLGAAIAATEALVAERDAKGAAAEPQRLTEVHADDAA